MIKRLWLDPKFRAMARAIIVAIVVYILGVLGGAWPTP